MKRTISSALTFIHKFVVPPFIVIWFFFFVVWSIVSRDESAPPVVFDLFGLAIAAVVLWSSWGLKTVAIDDQNLYVSNFRKEITIPISQIEDVREFLLSEPRRVTIYLSQPSEFGSKIVFLATYRAFAFLSPHPIVDELIQMAYRSRM